MEIDEDIEIDPNAPIHIRMELARKKMFRDFERKNREEEAEIAKKTRKPRKPKAVKPKVKKPVAPRTGKHRKTVPKNMFKEKPRKPRKPITSKAKVEKPVAPRNGKHRKTVLKNMVKEKPKKRKIGDKATPKMLKRWDNMGLPVIPRSKQPKDKKPFRTFVKIK